MCLIVSEGVEDVTMDGREKSSGDKVPMYIYVFKALVLIC